jgi:hypothetical protein
MKEINEKDKAKVMFVCPNDGEIERDDVLFLCNTCERDELKLIDGIYMCPSCLKPGENFECRICESKQVEMKKKTTSENTS